MAFNPLGSLGNLTGGLSVGGLLSGNPSIGGAFSSKKEKDKLSDKATGELKNLYPTPEGALQYPMDLDDHHYIMFNIQNRIPKNDLVNNPQYNYKTKQTIVLPLPLNMRNDMGVSYGSTNLGAMGGMGAGATELGDLYKDFATTIRRFGSKAVQGSWSNIKSLGSQIMTDLEKQGAAETALDVGAGLLGIEAATSGLEQLGVGPLVAPAAVAAKIAQGAFFAEGIAFNPRMAINFENVNFREFGFNYRMIARNREESDQITKIVKSFQYYMLPSYYGQSRSGFKYPDEFIIEFAQGIQEHLFKFQPCVLKNVSVQYNADSGPAFFDDSNAPISVDISLQFQETRILTKETFDAEEKFESQLQYARDVGAEWASQNAGNEQE